MSENPQVKAILEHIETRERELVDQAEQLRASIEGLTRQLGEIDAENENLHITRKTLLALPLPSPAAGPDRPDIPDHPAYRQILNALADEGRPMRARDLCQAIDLPIAMTSQRRLRRLRGIPRSTRTRTAVHRPLPAGLRRRVTATPPLAQRETHPRGGQP
ncbi:hypothetical protein ACGFYV_29150 [Streptomyces sp. NPDC048297]|uniref:hypothetical protein n=1 Tax=Streptomyces sp. NPDC048297 TaxID=3365531 RepID=UPI00371CA907